MKVLLHLVNGWGASEDMQKVLKDFTEEKGQPEHSPDCFKEPAANGVEEHWVCETKCPSLQARWTLGQGK